MLGAGLTLAGPKQLLIAGIGLVAVGAILDLRDRVWSYTSLVAAAIATTQVLPIRLPWHVGPLAVGVIAIATSARARECVRKWAARPVGSATDVLIYVGGAGVTVLALAVLDRLDDRLIFVGSPSLLAVAFGVLTNSIVEESTWRGIFIGASPEKPFWWNNLAQSASFGIAHWNGFLGGSIGVASAFVFGVAMGIFAKRSGSLIVPVAVHICANVVIVSLLLN